MADYPGTVTASLTEVEGKNDVFESDHEQSDARSDRETCSVKLKVTRRDLRNVDITSDVGHKFCLTKSRVLGGLKEGPEWHLADAKQNSLVVKKQPFHQYLTFNSNDGVQLATLTWGILSCSSHFTWQHKTYKWKRVFLALPLKLQLFDTSNGQKVAVMDRAWAACNPWGSNQGTLTLLTEQNDPTWLLMVIASALKESNRLVHKGLATTAGG